MSKSKETRWFILEDGRRARFNRVKYMKEFKQKAIALNKAAGKKAGGKTKLQRLIAQAIAPYEDESTAIARIRQWSYGNNGPSSPEDIYLLATVFGFEDKETFFIFENDVKETIEMNNKMNNLDHDQVLCDLNRKAIKSALFALKEKEVASDLYSYLLDLLAKTYRADVKVWEYTLYDSPRDERWEEVSPLYPSRYEAITAIRKTASFLSEEIREEAVSLVDDVLAFDLTFDCVDHPRLPSIDDEFITVRNEQFDSYVAENRIDLERRSKDDVWVDFINDQAEYRYAKLDEIFENYLC